MGSAFRYVFMLCTLIYISAQTGFALQSNSGEQYISFTSQISIKDLESYRQTLCSSPGSYLNKEEQLCFEINTDYSIEDPTLFVSRARFNMFNLENNYELIIENFDIQISDTKADLNTLTNKPTHINTILNHGQLNIDGYKQYILANQESINLTISLDMKWKLLTANKKEYLETTIPSLNPVPIKSITSGRYDSTWQTPNENLCFLTENGKVICTGSNEFAQIGIGKKPTTNNQSTTLSESSYIDFGLSEIDKKPFQAIQLVTLKRTFCALFKQGFVKCWGSNTSPDGHRMPSFYGLGTDSRIGDQPEEVKNTSSISFTEPIVKLFTTERNICGLTNKENIKCWGDNRWNILAQDISEYPKTQQEIYDMPYIEVANVKNLHFSDMNNTLCSISHTGIIYCWGNKSGSYILSQPKIPRAEQTIKPTPNLSNFKPIALPQKPIKKIQSAGSGTICILYDEGYIYCWGSTNSAHAGQERRHLINPKSLRPEELKSIQFDHPIVDFATSSYNHVCALLENGKIKCWGNSLHRNIKDKKLRYLGDHPGEMANLEDLPFGNRKAISLHSTLTNICALFDTKELICWGYNGYGQLGQGSTESYVDINDIKPIFTHVNIKKVYMHANRICVLSEEGQVVCIGDNRSGQLGQGTKKESLGTELHELNGMEYIALGKTRVESLLLEETLTCAIFITKQVKCWGNNVYGVLGQKSSQALIGDDSLEMENLDYLDFSHL